MSFYVRSVDPSNRAAITNVKRQKYGALMEVLDRAKNARTNYDQHGKLGVEQAQYGERTHLNDDSLSDSSSTPSSAVSANAAYSRPRIKNPTRNIFDSLDLTRNMSNGVSSHPVDNALSDESANGTQMLQEVG